MKTVTQLHGTTPEQLTETILKGIQVQFDDLKKDFQPKEQDEFLTRKETSAFLKISLVCLHDWCKKGVLRPYKVGNRTYFKKNEIVQTLLDSNVKNNDKK